MLSAKSSIAFILALLLGSGSTAGKNATFRLSSLVEDSFQGNVPGIRNFVSSLRTLLQNGFLDGIVNNRCALHLNDWVNVLESKDGEAFTETGEWALQMVDSWGKIPEGILSGHVNSWGDFDECINIKASNISGINDHFEGRYCTAYVVDYNTSAEASTAKESKIDTLNVYYSNDKGELYQESISAEELFKILLSPQAGVGIMMPSIATCFPNSCLQEDIQNILFSVLKSIYKLDNPDVNLESMPYLYAAVCEQKAKEVMTGADVVVTILLAFLVTLTVIAGLADYYWICRGDDRRPRSRVVKYLMAFSFYTNTVKWLSTKKNPEDFGCLHGIRFLSTCWVVLCHAYFVFGTIPSWNLIDAKHLQKSWTLMPVLNGSFSVDSFFVMSGMLVTYNILKTLHKTKGKLNLVMLYVHRYIRLTPTYAILIAIMATVIVYTGNGPFWTGMHGSAKLCRDNWWTNLLYINNLVNTNQICLGNSWYLANDMQFYILAPFIVYPLWKWTKPGLGLLSVYTVLSCLSPVFIVRFYHTPPAAFDTRDIGKNFNEIYQRPWARIQTFFAGVWLGWVLFKTRGKQLHISRPVVAVLWVTSAVLALTVIYAIKPWYDPSFDIPEVAGYFYAALSRFTYAVSLCWVIFACVKGYGGIINRFLSWSVFMPLGRLTFSIYLFSVHLQYFFHARLSVPLKYETYTMVNLFFAHMVTSIIVGYVCTILFESPFIVLQKLIFESSPEQPKRSPPPKEEPSINNA